MYVMDTDSKTEIYTVVDVAADIEVVLSDIAPCCLVEVVSRGIIVTEVVLIFYKVLIIEIVELVVRNCRAFL